MGSTRKHVGTTFAKKKLVPQWQGLMKKFAEKHKVKCKSEPIELTEIYQTSKNFPTGSLYSGECNALGMQGYGKYTFPNGVQYEGEFLDGQFHGKGELSYYDEDYSVIRGTWDRGVLTEKTLFFSNALEYSNNMWIYCRMPDRRFGIEYKEGLSPAGKSVLAAKQPIRKIAPGWYDTGDGTYDPKTKVVYKYNTTSIERSPSIAEQKWIVANCRQTGDEPLGPLPYLYEDWSEPSMVLPKPPPPPASDIKNSTTSRKPSEDYKNVGKKRPSFYDPPAT